MAPSVTSSIFSRSSRGWNRRLAREASPTHSLPHHHPLSISTVRRRSPHRHTSYLWVTGDLDTKFAAALDSGPRLDLRGQGKPLPATPSTAPRRSHSTVRQHVTASASRSCTVDRSLHASRGLSTRPARWRSNRPRAHTPDDSNPPCRCTAPGGSGTVGCTPRLRSERQRATQSASPFSHLPIHFNLLYFPTLHQNRHSATEKCPPTDSC